MDVSSDGGKGMTETSLKAELCTIANGLFYFAQQNNIDWAKIEQRSKDLAKLLREKKKLEAQGDITKI